MVFASGMSPSRERYASASTAGFVRSMASGFVASASAHVFPPPKPGFACLRPVLTDTNLGYVPVGTLRFSSSNQFTIRCSSVGADCERVSRIMMKPRPSGVGA
jgi:hypothetical protein